MRCILAVAVGLGVAAAVGAAPTAALAEPPAAVLRYRLTHLPTALMKFGGLEIGRSTIDEVRQRFSATASSARRGAADAKYLYAKSEDGREAVTLVFGPSGGWNTLTGYSIGPPGVSAPTSSSRSETTSAPVGIKIDELGLRKGVDTIAAKYGVALGGVREGVVLLDYSGKKPMTDAEQERQKVLEPDLEPNAAWDETLTVRLSVTDGLLAAIEVNYTLMR
jgi:hypothetical protein